MAPNIYNPISSSLIACGAPIIAVICPSCKTITRSESRKTSCKSAEMSKTPTPAARPANNWL